MTYLTLTSRRGERGETGRLLEKAYIESIKNTPMFREFVEIVKEALKE